MKISMEIEGMEALRGTVERTVVRVRKEAKKIVLNEAQEIMDESLNEVPRDTGALASSAFLEKQANGDVLFGYGSTKEQLNPKTKQVTSEYMVAVHERLDVTHPIGKAKFLEDPMNRHTVKIEARAAARFRKLFR